MNKIRNVRSWRVLSVALAPLAIAAVPLQAAHAAMPSPSADLAARVQAALAASPQADDLRKVVVQVEGGVLRLTGWVDEPREAQWATRVARMADSSVVVDNRIRTWSTTDYQ